MRPASIIFTAAMLLLCAAATKTIAWSTHSYKPLTLKAGTLVTFKWSGFHDVAVSKLNEKSTQRCKAARKLSKAKVKGSLTIRVGKGFYWYSCTVGNHCKAGQAILIRGV